MIDNQGNKIQKLLKELSTEADKETKDFYKWAEQYKREAEGWIRVFEGYGTHLQNARNILGDTTSNINDILTKLKGESNDQREKEKL